MIETLLIILAVGALCIGCFIVGAKVGQKVAKGEEIKMSYENPFEAYRKREAKREAEKEQNKIDTILQNIECYDGTTKGQKDV